MDRRQFLLAVPGGALLPSWASAQEPGRIYRMAVISPSEATVEMIWNLQLPELARRGFVVGRNLTVTTYVGLPARMPELAREAIATKPDVVVAVSNVAILAVKEAWPRGRLLPARLPMQRGVTKEIRRREDDQRLGAGRAHAGERCDSAAYRAVNEPPMNERPPIVGPRWRGESCWCHTRTQSW
jgi:hypothetical protein